MGEGQLGDVELSNGGGHSSQMQSPQPQTFGNSYEDLVIDEPAPPTEAGAANATRVEALQLPRLGFGGLGVASSPPTQQVAHACRVAKVLIKGLSIGLILGLLLVALARWPRHAFEDKSLREQLLSTLFVIGLTMVALEDLIGINKSSVMMVLAASMWTFLAVSYHPIKSKVGASELHQELNRGLQEVGSVILFLLPAMGVVESIDHFEGFSIAVHLIRRSTAGRKERLMPVMCLLTFLLSSVIDNLTATIVALKLLRHLVPNDTEWRLSCGGTVVIAANAGGAWSPIGDVTTTMLWIQGKITAPQIVAWLLLPSFVAGFVPLLGIWWQAQSRNEAAMPRIAQGHGRHFSELREEPEEPTEAAQRQDAPKINGLNGEEPPVWGDINDQHAEVTHFQVLALALGVAFILLVPVLKMCTGLPPYLGMLLALGLFWQITDSLSGFTMPEGEESAKNEGPSQTGVVAALHKVDLTGLLFFTGVLLAVGALDSAGVLRAYATMLVKLCGPSPLTLAALLGVSSAVVDNVPLVEAAIDMFREKGTDDALWQLVALAAGTGGSILSIGSIAGVTLMSMEGVGFLWYCRRVSLWAVLGFVMGLAVYHVEHVLAG